MVGVGQRLCRLLVHIDANGVVQEKVELDGEICLDGICAVACVEEGRFDASALLPQVTPDAVANLVIINVRNEEIGMSVVDSACDVLNAQPFPSAFKQNLDDVPMVNILHYE